MAGVYDYKNPSYFKFGQVAEWFKAAVLKIAVGASLPWVRIPPCPPFFLFRLKISFHMEMKFIFRKT